MVSPPADPEQAHDAPPAPEPAWAVIDDAPADRPPARRAVRRLTPGVVAVLLLLLLGRTIPAIVVLGVCLLGSAVGLLHPAYGDAFDRLMEWVQVAVARGISVVALTLVYLLGVAPIALIMRVLRIDPLELGAGESGSSLWRPASTPAGRSPLYRRQFTYERLAPAPRGAPRRGVRVLAWLAALVLLDITAGALLHDLSDRGAGPAARQSLLFDSHAAAGRGETWLPELAREIDAVWYGKHYDPYLGWRLPDFAGSYVHERGGIRQSYAPPFAPGRRAVRVFFFGGSTMFGLFQRDAHTIPSDVARLAAADGLPLRVYNYGALAYNNWQELLLMQEVVSAGAHPDLVVFYDGANELVGQFRLGPHVQPSQQEATNFARLIGLGLQGAPPPRRQSSLLGQLLRSWRNASATVWTWRKLRGLPTDQQGATSVPLVSPWAGNQQAEAMASGRDGASLLDRGIGLERRLGQSSGFRTAFFLQPMLYSKPVVAGEQSAVGALGTDPLAWRRAYSVLRSRLSPGASDLTSVLDPVKAPVMFDFVHTNELGARVVSAALYRRIRPMLARLAAGAR